MPDMYLMHPGHPLPLAVVWRHHIKRTHRLRIPRYLHPRKEPTMSTESVTPMSETAYGRKIASGAYFNGAFQSPKVSLDKITRDVQVERGGANVQTRLPRYPLMGHREGLRMNDMITLASALWVLALHSGTAHQTPAVQSRSAERRAGKEGVR